MAKHNDIATVETGALQPLEQIENLIHVIRDKQVMLDRDLARLYGVETRVLNQAVQRNIERLPEDFMFQLSIDEVESLRSQFVMLNDGSQNLESQNVISSWGGVRKWPYVFTENGVDHHRLAPQKDVIYALRHIKHIRPLRPRDCLPLMEYEK